MHSKSSDPVGEALSAAADRIVERVRQLATSNPVVLIDGRSGAGKTTLASLIVQRWPLVGGVQSIALDSIYPGWDGLQAGSERAYDRIILPHARGMWSTWSRWDWEQRRDAENHAVDPAQGVILEGCGAATRETARLADLTVWVEAPDAARQRRALDRDGDTYRPHWERWARQEEQHIARNRPQELADIHIRVP